MAPNRSTIARFLAENGRIGRRTVRLRNLVPLCAPVDFVSRPKDIDARSDFLDNAGHVEPHDGGQRMSRMRGRPARIFVTSGLMQLARMRMSTSPGRTVGFGRSTRTKGPPASSTMYACTFGGGSLRSKGLFPSQKLMIRRRTRLLWDRSFLDAVFRLQHAGSSFADDNTRCHRVTGANARQNGGVRYPKTFYAINLELTVDN